MERVSVDEIEMIDAAQGFRILTNALGATDVAINRYDLAPGGRIGGYHAHHDQEEVFYVLSGQLTLETEDGDVRVGPDEAVYFDRGEFHFAYNAGDEPVRSIALGAPPDSQEIESVRECGGCGDVFHHHRASFATRGIGPDDPARQVECPECGAETRRIGRPD
jgi:uncharacterized cupin superfamily protein